MAVRRVYPVSSHDLPTIAVFGFHASIQHTKGHTALPRSLSESDSAIVGSHGGEERMSLQNLVPNRAHPRIEGGAEDLTLHAL